MFKQIQSGFQVLKVKLKKKKKPRVKALTVVKSLTVLREPTEMTTVTTESADNLIDVAIVNQKKRKRKRRKRNKQTVEGIKKVKVNENLLVIFDLNGTLISRVTSSKKRAAKLNPYLPSQKDFGNKGSSVYIRPYWNDLLDTVFNLKNVSVGVWTSAQKDNADRLVNRLFGEYREHVEFVLNRSHCLNAPMNIKVDTVIKDLSIIYNSSEFNKDGLWSPENTILVDDTITKAKKDPKNILVIPEFDVSNSNVNCQEDVELLRLKQWLEKLEDRILPDVRDVIDAYPLSSEEVPELD
ncbi:NLI interacting factor-like phosphatase-domain-containing protein [Globomyces pollinis-pini]|nr:NLI interacting factor-like phosphatase-domain-containing protein [Globomyces pollinis-pini]